MGFLFFFMLFILIILIIGFFPQLKRFFSTGELRVKLWRVFLWFISSIGGFVTFFQLRRAYQVLSHFEDFWQAMMFFENFLTGLLIVAGFIFSFLLYGHYQEDSSNRFWHITSWQLFWYGFINLVRLVMIYRIHKIYSGRRILFYLVLVVGGILIYKQVYKRTGYSLKKFYSYFFE